MDRKKLRALFEKMKDAEKVSGKLYDAKENSFEDNLAYQVAWKHFSDTVYAYNDAVNEFLKAGVA